MAWAAANRRSTTQDLLILAALAAISVLFVGGGWVSDDFVHVHRLQQVPSTARILTDADGFDFYRPLAQWSLWAQGRVHGFTPSLFRAANVILHIAICMTAYLVARRLVSERAAWLAALTFVLTPKAPTVAVLWASARPELLMSVFALVATLAWLRWNERGGWSIALAIAAYLLAFLSKETALLLPIVLLTMIPRQSRTSATERSFGVAALLVVAAIPIVLRMRAGALMPTSSHEHYQLDFSFYRMLRSLEVYVPRALPSPVGLLVCVGLPAMLLRKGDAARVADLSLSPLRVATIATAWFFAFILPVFPIPARSELYLYLPGLGFCILAGYVVDQLLLRTVNPSRILIAGVLLYALAFLGYQQTRNAQVHQVQQFTQSLVDTLRADMSLRSFHGELRFIASDPGSEELMRDGVGGYINGVTALAMPDHPLAARVLYRNDQPGAGEALVLEYRFAGGRLSLTRR